MDVDSKSIPEPTTAGTVRGPIAWLTLWLLVAAGFFWFGLRDTDKSVQVSTKTVAAAQQSNYKTKDIADIREGDIVLARDEFGNDLGIKRVVEVYRRTSDHLRILTFHSPDGNEQTLKTTNEHPFWVESRNTFVDAGKLRIGDTVEGPHGEIQTVASTIYEPHPNGIPVFNFQVEDYHTYFVKENGARAPPVLVHNADYAPNIAQRAYQSGPRMADRQLLRRNTNTAHAQNVTEWRRSISRSNIRNERIKFVGEDAVKIDAGTWRSLDGTRQFRTVPNDYLGRHGIGQPSVPNTPHVHFEHLAPPNPGGSNLRVLKNVHVPLVD